jgi:hypothetical protein
MDQKDFLLWHLETAMAALASALFGKSGLAVTRATKALFFLAPTLEFLSAEERNRVFKRCERLQNLLAIRGRSDHQS